MRISDWSSDVCSSDLPAASVQPGGEGRDFPLQRFDIGGETLDPVGRASVAAAIPAYVVTIGKVRSEERRVGKECVIRVDLGGRRISKKKKQSIQINKERSETKQKHQI